MQPKRFWDTAFSASIDPARGSGSGEPPSGSARQRWENLWMPREDSNLN